ncbi:MAG: TRAP transporter small permease [candidate division WOR-3 bacterium]
MRGKSRIIQNISEGLLKTSAICLIILSILVTYMVVRRYVFKSPEPYSYELSAIIVLVASILSIAGIQAHDRHLKVDFILLRMKPTPRKVLSRILAPLIGIIYTALMAIKSAEATWHSAKMNELSQSIWREPLWPIRGIVVVGVVVLCLVLLDQLIKGIEEYKSGEN